MPNPVKKVDRENIYLIGYKPHSRKLFIAFGNHDIEASFLFKHFPAALYKELAIKADDHEFDIAKYTKNYIIPFYPSEYLVGPYGKKLIDFL